MNREWKESIFSLPEQEVTDKEEKEVRMIHVVTE